MTDQDQSNLAQGIANPCLYTTNQTIMKIPDPIVRAHRIGLQLAMEHVILLYDQGDDVDGVVKIDFSKELLSGLVRPAEINARLLQGGQAVSPDDQALPRITAAIDALIGWRPVGSGSGWTHEDSREIINDNTLCRLEMAVEQLERQNKLKPSLPKGLFDLDVERVARLLILNLFGRFTPSLSEAGFWEGHEEMAGELLSGCRPPASSDRMGKYSRSHQLGALVKANLEAFAPNDIEIIRMAGEDRLMVSEYALRRWLSGQAEEGRLPGTYALMGPLGRVARPMVNPDEPSVTRLSAWREAWRDGMQDHAYGRLLQALNLK